MLQIKKSRSRNNSNRTISKQSRKRKTPKGKVTLTEKVNGKNEHRVKGCRGVTNVKE